MNRRQFIVSAAASTLAVAARAADQEAKLRIAVIGHTGRGDFGHSLDIMWLNMPETTVVAVADANPAGLAKARERLRGVPGFEDYRKMLAETKPDIVSIALRHIDQHRDMALAAVESGARGIYMEKPFCRTPAEAGEIIATCEKRGTKLALAHRNRYHPALPTVEKLVRDGGIGQLLEVRGRGKEDARGGALDLWVLGSHVLNLAHYFVGKPLACTASMLQDGRPVTRADVRDGAEGVGPIAGNELHSRFETERGVPLFFDSIAKAGNTEAGFGLQLIGTKGIIDLRCDKHPIAHIAAGSPFAPDEKARAWVPISSAGAGKPEPIADAAAQVSSHKLVARDLFAAIRDNRAPLCDAHAGAATVEMICAVFESHRLGGQRVAIPLKTRQNPLTML